ncbi:hypothetical protein [Burkholderia pseudomallei]|uniref:hypothetical protein n=1 Tax=Burkholderia pseudomallei TaxID=28450 RepID=UPI000537C760|nr:hypothetical protein [Burkholderia pseudomallei]KGW18146.1 hypothetical protein X980_6057 [Burkholderia pseudomallei MSHR4000]MBF3523933.1 hypothetical protein [Burkholderia pseudomallei]MBF3538488.1 hypothetical protein [Burkholderia pseudomallei]MBF3600747.1 hypothetical protein [Burkholderia pseudomallei]
MFSVALLKRFVEPRTGLDFVGGQLPHVLAVDPPMGSVRETRSQHTITPKHGEAARRLYDLRGRRIYLTDRGVSLFDPRLVRL